MSDKTNQQTQPQVPCPYGDHGSVDLSYYLIHQADFCFKRGELQQAKLFEAAADWVSRITNAV